MTSLRCLSTLSFSFHHHPKTLPGLKKFSPSHLLPSLVILVLLGGFSPITSSFSLLVHVGDCNLQDESLTKDFAINLSQGHGKHKSLFIGETGVNIHFLLLFLCWTKTKLNRLKKNTFLDNKQFHCKLITDFVKMELKLGRLKGWSDFQCNGRAYSYSNWVKHNIDNVFTVALTAKLWSKFT